MQKRILFSLLISLVSVMSWAQSAKNLVIYPAPADAPKAENLQVKVNGQEVFVYQTPVAAYAYFSFTGKAQVSVTAAEAVETVNVRPLSKKIKATTAGKQVNFTINQPANLSVELNKNTKMPLFLFANPLEKDAPKPQQANIRYYEGGKIHDVGTLRLKSNETLYIAGGAVLRGSVMLEDADNVKIVGRGVLDGSLYKKGESRMIEVNRCKNLLIDGIIVTNSKHWTIPLLKSRNIQVSNVKLISGNDWDDGIDVVGSQNVFINNCFIRTKDDCIAVKSGVNYFTKYDSSDPVDNVKATNCVFWNAEWGNALEIGFETRTSTISNVTFEDCDIIHVQGPEGTFTIHNGDRAHVQNVLYKDIRVEDVEGLLVDFKILQARYSKDAERGKVSNVVFKNITVVGNRFPNSIVRGFDAEHLVKGVKFEDFKVLGKEIKNTEEGKFEVSFAEDIKFD